MAQSTRPYGMTVIDQLPLAYGQAPATNAITTGGQVQSLFTASQITIGWFVQNPATGTANIIIDFIGAGGPTSFTKIDIEPGAFFKADFIPANGVNIYGPNTGQPFTAGAW